MVKILSTLGPESEGKNLKFFIKRSDMVRLNMSHNYIDWHKKNIKKIRLIDKKKLILVDIPGVKPRTLNSTEIRINKGDVLEFCFKKKIKNLLTCQIPYLKLKKILNTFHYLMDYTNLK